MEAYDALKRGIQAMGFDMRDIEQVVLTHHHPDHAGWVDAFPNAEILGHAYNDKWLRHDEDFYVTMCSFTVSAYLSMEFLNNISSRVYMSAVK